MLIPRLIMSQPSDESTHSKTISLVKMSYNGARYVAELSPSLLVVG